MIRRNDIDKMVAIDKVLFDGRINAQLRILVTPSIKNLSSVPLMNFSHLQYSIPKKQRSKKSSKTAMFVY